jgi:hypothetical protein
LSEYVLVVFGAMLVIGPVLAGATIMGSPGLACACAPAA